MVHSPALNEARHSPLRMRVWKSWRRLARDCSQEITTIDRDKIEAASFSRTGRLADVRAPESANNTGGNTALPRQGIAPGKLFLPRCNADGIATLSCGGLAMGVQPWSFGYGFPGKARWALRQTIRQCGSRRSPWSEDRISCR